MIDASSQYNGGYNAALAGLTLTAPNGWDSDYNRVVSLKNGNTTLKTLTINGQSLYDSGVTAGESKFASVGTGYYKIARVNTTLYEYQGAYGYVRYPATVYTIYDASQSDKTLYFKEN